MPRTSGAKTREAIRTEAIALFFRHGYEATTLRQLADAVDLQVGSLYNHLAGKEDLLFEIMSGIMDDLIVALDEAVDGRASALDALRAAIDCHVRFHAQRAQEVFIGNSELRSLGPGHRAHVVKLRDAYEGRIRGLVEQAAGEIGAPVLDLRLQTYAILAMGTHVSTWYREGGSMSLDQIVGFYTDMVLRQVGVQLARTGAIG